MDAESFLGSAALQAAAWLALGWIGQAERCRSRIVGAAALCMAFLSLWVGVDAKWHVLYAFLPSDVCRVYVQHPGLCIRDDMADIVVVMAISVFVAAMREIDVLGALGRHAHGRYLFVKPGDRPRPRVSPFERQP